MANLDKPDLKERQRTNWAAAAAGWRRRDELLRKGAASVTERLLALAKITSGSHLLDIASGTGEPAITAAKIIGDSGLVLGTDLVDEMLVVAREKAAKENLANLEFRCVDAETLNLAADSFDAVTCRWGLMFMPAPQTCLAAAYQALKPNGRISLACWAAPEKNPFVSVLITTLRRYLEVPIPPPDSPGIFAFADPERLRAVLAAAGFKNIAIEELEINVLEVADGRAYWEAISDLAAPVMTLLQRLEDSARADYIEEVIAVADTMKKGETLQMKGTTWIASADK